jgi:hypothetical protein
LTGLRQFALNAGVRHADFSPRVRRESFAAPNASYENLFRSTRLRATKQKDKGPALRRPSSFNQGVVGSSPTRLTKNYENFRDTSPAGTSSCAEIVVDSESCGAGRTSSRTATAARS